MLLALSFQQNGPEIPNLSSPGWARMHGAIARWMPGSPLSNTVIAGLDPAIQPTRETRRIHQAFLDRRVKPGDDSLRGDMLNAITSTEIPISTGQPWLKAGHDS